jgi:HlyD family secretion protein
MLEARIRPEEINHVHLGQVARIKFSALRYRNSAMVRGKVTYIAADRLVDKGSGQPYFTVLIAADAASIKAAGDLKLLAGMPAEVYIEGSKQTPLEYLMEPVTSSIRRAGRQL